MTTQFLSKTERGIGPETNNPRELSNVGPGLFNPSSFESALPGFTPFGSSTKRASIPVRETDTPGPGGYEIQGSLLTGTSTGAAKTAFKSKSKRFDPGSHVKLLVDVGAAPLPSTIKNGRPKVFAKQSSSNGLSLLANVMTAAPAIPGKRQAAGYEPNEEGRLVLAKEVNPGFTGEVKDAVGPGDYDPKITHKYGNAPVPSFKV